MKDYKDTRFIEYGDRIRAKRKEHYLSQDGLADLLSKEGIVCSQQMISKIERGIEFPKIEMLKKLLEILGMSADHLIYGKEAVRDSILQIDVEIDCESKKIVDTRVKEQNS